MPGTNNPFLQELIDQYLRSDPTAAFNYQFSPFLSQYNPFGNWLKGQSSNYLARYLGQLPNNPEQSYTDYLGTVNPLKEFGGLTPRQRGMSGVNVVPQVRYPQMFGFR